MNPSPPINNIVSVFLIFCWCLMAPPQKPDFSIILEITAHKPSEHQGLKIRSQDISISLILAMRIGDREQKNVVDGEETFS